MPSASVSSKQLYSSLPYQLPIYLLYLFKNVDMVKQYLYPMLLLKDIKFNASTCKVSVGIE